MSSDAKMNDIIDELQKRTGNFGINRRSALDVERGIHLFEIMFEKEQLKKSSVVLQNWDFLLEDLSDLEHKQWAHWTKYMLDNITDLNIKRWQEQIETDYKDLTEKEKESDRGWARKVLKLLEEQK